MIVTCRTCGTYVNDRRIVNGRCPYCPDERPQTLPAVPEGVRMIPRMGKGTITYLNGSGHEKV